MNSIPLVIGLFKLSILFWVSCDSWYFIAIGPFHLSCQIYVFQYYLIIFFLSVESLVIISVISDIGYLGLLPFFFVRLCRNLSILMIFSKNMFFVSLSFLFFSLIDWLIFLFIFSTCLSFVILLFSKLLRCQFRLLIWIFSSFFNLSTWWYKFPC